MANPERSESTKRGLLAERLVREAVNGQTGVCDIHTPKGGFEVRWGNTTKNAAGLAADRARAQQHGGYCVQVSGPLQGHRRHGDRSLTEFLQHHGHTLEQAQQIASAIREQAGNGQCSDGDPHDDQLTFQDKRTNG